MASDEKGPSRRLLGRSPCKRGRMTSEVVQGDRKQQREDSPRCNNYLWFAGWGCLYVLQLQGSTTRIFFNKMDTWDVTVCWFSFMKFVFTEFLSRITLRYMINLRMGVGNIWFLETGIGMGMYIPDTICIRTKFSLFYVTYIIY